MAFFVFLKFSLGYRVWILCVVVVFCVFGRMDEGFVVFCDGLFLEGCLLIV